MVAVGDVDSMNIPGGQLMRTTEVFNYPGFPEGITGPELIERFTSQAKNFGAEFVSCWATNFRFSGESHHLVRVGSDDLQFDAVILANGASPKMLQLPREENLLNRGISSCATCDGPLPVFRNKHLYVVGGGDTAAEEALFLSKFASKVSIIHRRSELRAAKSMQDQIFQNPKISVIWDTVITNVIGEGQLEKLELKNLKTNITEQVTRKRRIKNRKTIEKTIRKAEI
eukprot:TRINITY_DN2155_c0_g1_i1.p1 TRINITY_DN2155_c0_g1~~TRINITY_DN2155_c0_g1_i1.p1  ORF type:complete len:258 (+),score=30.45 TRINITY_DN2155_c0_g1_i1:93-776(+)